MAYFAGKEVEATCLHHSIISKSLVVIALLSLQSNCSAIESDCSSSSCADISDRQYLLQTVINVENLEAVDANTSLWAKQHIQQRVNDSQKLDAAKNETNPVTAADYSGVKENAAGDLGVFLTALMSNVFLIGCCILFFLYCRHRYSDVYEYPLTHKLSPEIQVEDGMLDWARRSMKVTVDEVQDHAGMDMAMLLEFCHLGMKIMAIVGVPMILIMGPMNWAFGGHAAGDDRLSYLSFGNVETGSWLYWIHAFVVWGVVFTVQVCVYRGMDMFMKQRQRWLQELPDARANTILVEEIPEEQQSDMALKTYFEQMFGAGKIKSAKCVKICPDLTALIEKKTKLRTDLSIAKSKESKGLTLETSIQDLESEIAIVGQEIKKERTKVLEKANELGGVNGNVGFVEFQNRSLAELAATANYSMDIHTWEVSTPPPPQTIMWDNLKQGSTSKVALIILGYALVVTLYFFYLPLVIWITRLATSINLGPFQALWASFAPTMGLQIMVAFLPTFLILIFSLCFPLTDSASSQQMLQNWYFVFQVVFVILVTAIGSNLREFMLAVAQSPLEMVNILGKSMPPATHFYMNFLVLQWTTHFMNLTRYIQLSKYIMFSKMFTADEAKEMCEPEDQDYYGIGSRSARFTINLAIGIVFGTLSPPICLLSFINFMVCRLVYGYLIVFAETRKPDLGGEFWVHQLKHIFWANIIYCIMMTGVLLGRASSNVPGAIACASLVYVVWSYQRFNTRFNWERLPYHEVATKNRTASADRAFFEQPEFVD